MKHVVEHVRLRKEAQKRGLGSRIDIKLCRLEKGPDGNKAYAINIQASGMKKDPCSVIEEWFCKVRHTTVHDNNYRGCMILHQCDVACLSYLLVNN